MVRKAFVQEEEHTAGRAVVLRDYEAEHREYWGPDAVVRRKRFAKMAFGVGATIDQAFHIRDGFRILCDGLPDGAVCGNNVGPAPLARDHDGLCERCHRNRVPFPPRTNLDPERVIYSWDDMDDWMCRGSPNSAPLGDSYEPDPEPDAEGDTPPPAEVS